MFGMGMLDRLFSVMYRRINNDPQAAQVYTLQAFPTTPSQVVVGYDTVPVEQNGYTYLTQTPVQAALSQYPYSYMTIEGGRMYLYNVPGMWTSDNTGKTIDLSQYTINSLQGQLTPYFTVTEGSGWVKVSDKSALTLMSVQDMPLLQGAVTLSAFTSNTWRTLAPIAFILERAKADVMDALSATSIPTASGFWVDFWAWFAGLTRFAGESDSSLIKRLLLELNNPKVTNIAMQEYLTTYFNNMQFNVQDTSAGNFEVLADPGTMGGWVTQVEALVNEIKAAGAQWVMNFQSKQSDNFRSYYQSRQGVDFSTGDSKLNLQFGLQEERYGYLQNSPGWVTNTSLTNTADTGFGRALRETKLVMYYNSPTDPSYTVIPV